MTRKVPSEWGTLLAQIAGSPRLAHALATTGVGIAALSFPIERMFGWTALVSGLVVLLGLMVVSFIARRRESEWRGILPISLLAVLVWASASLIWSQYQWATIGGLAYIYAFTVLGLYVALMRDTIQIVRLFGDVLRLVLVLSVAVEILSGLLIDTPITLLAVSGDLASGGPISGMLGTRNQLGLVAIVGAITFVTELRTRSVPRLVSVLSLVLAGICLIFTQSPVALGTAGVVGLAALVLYGIRRIRPERQQIWQFAVLGFATVAAVVTWIARSVVVETLNAGGALTYRLLLWNQIFDLVRLHLLEGWGWIGRWRTELTPFTVLTTSADRQAQSGLNAYLDVWFQLGAIGLVLVVGMLGLAFVRSWLLAGRRRSVIYAWPAVVLLALIIFSLAESSLLVEFGWVLLVICIMKASQELSWRQAFVAEPAR